MGDEFLVRFSYGDFQRQQTQIQFDTQVNINNPKSVKVKETVQIKNN